LERSQLSEQVMLKNGSVVSGPLVKRVMHMLFELFLTRGLYLDSMVNELVSKARDASFDLEKALEDYKIEKLKEYELLDEEGNIPESIRNILLSASEGEGRETMLVWPVRTESQAQSLGGKASDLRSTGKSLDHPIPDVTFQYDELLGQVKFIRKYLKRLIADEPRYQSLITVMTARSFLNLIAGKQSGLVVPVEYLEQIEVQEWISILSELFLQLHLTFGRRLMSIPPVSDKTGVLMDKNDFNIRLDGMTLYALPDKQMIELAKFLQQPLDVSIEAVSVYEGTIKNIALITRNRPKPLRRSLGRLLYNLTRHFEHIPRKTQTQSRPVIKIGILDDSDPDFEAENKRIIEKLGEQYRDFRVELVHVDMARKTQIKKSILAEVSQSEASESDRFEDILEKTFQRSNGGNRNWVSMIFGHAPYLMMDDDMHPFVTIEKGKSYPVDVLGNMNRAMGAGSSIAFYKYALEPDYGARELIRYNLFKEYSAESSQDLLLLGGNAYYLSILKKIDQKWGFFLSLGGMIAINPGRWPPPTVTAVRGEDGLYATLQNDLLRTEVQNRIFLQGGALDHYKEKGNRPNLPQIIFKERFESPFILRVLREIFKREITPEQSVTPEMLYKVSEAIRSISEKDIQDKIDQSIKASFTEMVLIYQMFVETGGLNDYMEIMGEFRSLFRDAYGVNLEDIVTGMEITDLTQLEINAEGALLMIRKSLLEFADILEYWPLIVDASRKVLRNPSIGLGEEQGQTIEETGVKGVKESEAQSLGGKMPDNTEERILFLTLRQMIVQGTAEQYAGKILSPDLTPVVFKGIMAEWFSKAYAEAASLGILTDKEIADLKIFGKWLTEPSAIERRVFDFRGLPEDPGELVPVMLYAQYHPEFEYHLILPEDQDISRLMAFKALLGQIPDNIQFQIKDKELFEYIVSDTKIPTGLIADREILKLLNRRQRNLIQINAPDNKKSRVISVVVLARRLLKPIFMDDYLAPLDAQDMTTPEIWQELLTVFQTQQAVSRAA